MRKVLLFSALLLLGPFGSQWLPAVIGPAYAPVGDVVRLLTMIGLSFIMIRVGYEFDIDKSNLRQYGWDYVVAFTAAKSGAQPAADGSVHRHRQATDPSAAGLRGAGRMSARHDPRRVRQGALPSARARRGAPRIR